MDRYDYPLPVSLLKIDVEGMEGEVLLGAREMLSAFRPVVFFEALDTLTLKTPCGVLLDLGYSLYWLETHQFNRANHRNCIENIWYRTEMGILAMPPGSPEISLPPVTGSETVLPFREDARAGYEVA